uniref:PDZ domain-containing protein n=1 Tax=Aureoumbra lagunensis TaxID=44058 RepID=A0A7S3JRR0_9STRA
MKKNVIQDAENRENVSFYQWDTPGKKCTKKKTQQKKPISHPTLKITEVAPQLTPLSEHVKNENLRRDAIIGQGYAKRCKELAATNLSFSFKFECQGFLGFKIILARGKRSSRRRVIVDETFDYCEAYSKLRPNDEIIAVDGDLLIDMDPEAFSHLVKRLRSIRPLTLTFAYGEGRDLAFKRQNECRAREASVIEEHVDFRAPIELTQNYTPSENTTTSPKNSQRISARDFLLYSLCSGCTCDNALDDTEESSSVVRGNISARYILPDLLSGDDDDQYYYLSF